MAIRFSFSQELRDRIAAQADSLSFSDGWRDFVRSQPQLTTPEVLQIIRSSTPPTTESERALNLLTTQPCKIVLTGQQVGLFGGPLLNLYKVITALALAEISNRAVPTVPIFWLQSEDHDLAEVDQVAIPTATGNLLTLQSYSDTNGDPQSLSAPPAENRRSLSELILPAGLENCLEQLRAAIHFYPNGEAVLESLNRCYRAGKPWTESFALFLSEIFGNTGLLFFDPKYYRSHGTWKNALVHRHAIAQALQSHSDSVQGQVQVALRADSPLFFIRNPDSGSRFRLQEEAPSVFREIGGEQRYTGEELLQLIDTQAERFTSSAILRPLLQEEVFPSSLFVGGNAEMKYFEQTSTISRYFGFTSNPNIIKRASFLIIEPKIQDILADLQCAPHEIRNNKAELAQHAASQLGLVTPLQLKTEVQTKVEALLKYLHGPVLAADTTLEGSLDKTRGKLDQALQTLLERYEQAVLRKNSVLLQKAERASAALYPNGDSQERVVGGLVFLAKYGAEFLSQIMSQLKLNHSGEQIVNLTISNSRTGPDLES